MCGIVGIMRFDGTFVDEAELASMSRRIAHRGPDGEGLFVSGVVGLAHRRLSILDLSEAAAQPMRDAAGRTAVICYNGEIYNFRELRESLIREGCSFRSTGDTEVLLAACMRWGVVEAARRMNGMFAFAYFDLARMELWLARDRMGIKPLFYHRTAERVLFASEIKALLGEVEARPDEGTLLGLLMGVPPHDPHTPFAGIKAVQAGEVIRVRPTGAWEAQTFFSLAEAVDVEAYRAFERMKDEEVIKEVAKVLEKSVGMHLVSDARVGSLASGGLDSSVVTCVARRELDGMGVYHADVLGKFSERVWVEELARHARMPLHVAEMTPERYVRALTGVTYTNECPVGFHPNTVPFFLVCQLAAADGVKVLLTGEGADELFGGYSTFRANARRRVFALWKRRVLRALSAIGIGRLGRILEWATEPMSGAQHERMAALATRGQSLLSAGDAEEVYAFVADPIERGFQVDCFTYMQSYLRSILWRNDRIGMAVGLESRVPFLENQLVRLAMNLPKRFKLRGGVNKWALRKAAGKYLPRDLCQRAKMGFPVDAGSYVRPGMEFFRGGFLESQLQMGRRALEKMVETERELYFGLVAAEVWGQMFFMRASADDVTDALTRTISQRRGTIVGGWSKLRVMVNQRRMPAAAAAATAVRKAG